MCAGLKAGEKDAELTATYHVTYPSCGLVAWLITSSVKKARGIFGHSNVYFVEMFAQ